MGKGKKHAAENRILVELLKATRVDAGFTQMELAKSLGKPQSYVSKVERGERLIDMVELRWWCQAVDHDLSDLVREWVRLS